MRFFLPTIVMLFCSCINSGSPSSDAKSESVRPVKSVIATPSNYTEREFVALSTPIDVVNLAFKVSGQITSIPISTGDIVEMGELLAQIDKRDFELQLSADKAAYEQSRSLLERAQRLLQHEAVSQQEVERAESDFKRAESTYTNARETLVETSLRAPFRAIVERVYADPFQRVQAGESVVRVVTPTTDRVGFTIPESLLSALRNPLTRFTVSFDNLPNVSFDAKIRDYAQTSSDASGFPVTLIFENSDPLLYPISSGMSCVITMTTPQLDKDAVMIPLSSIYAPISGGVYVWIIDSSDRVQLRKVVLDAPTGKSSVIVAHGVESGERVVTAGIYQLQENQRVKILK